MPLLLTMPPMLTPTIRSGLIAVSSRTSSTPTWASPRAPPPPSAMTTGPVLKGSLPVARSRPLVGGR